MTAVIGLNGMAHVTLTVSRFDLAAERSHSSGRAAQPSNLADETVHRGPNQEALATPNLQINQNVSLNFGSPLRMLVRR